MDAQPQGNPGLSPAVQAALSRRGLGSSGGQGALTQSSPGAAMANPSPQPMNPSEMTQASAPEGGPTPSAPPAPKFQPQDRTDLITLALIEQMKNDNKLTKEQTKMAQTASSSPLPENTSGFPVGGGYGHQRSMGGGSSMSSWDQPLSISQMQSDYNSGMGKDYSGMNNYGQSTKVY